MSIVGVRRAAVAALALVAAPVAAHAQVLSVDRAVELALRHNLQVTNADASVLDARGGVYSAYSGVLPSVSASYTRSGSWLDNRSGSEFFGGVQTPSQTFDYESYGTTPGVSGSWNVLNLSSWAGLSSARNGLKSARLSRTATRQDVAFNARRQFYEVVRTAQLAVVADEAVGLARDDERRVRALFEVGSVSRSDLLTAQVRTAQAELDSLTAHQAVNNQRIALASLLGVGENELGTVDTTLTAEPREIDEASLLAEAERARPDLQAAEAEVRAANAQVWSARMARLPYVTASGSVAFNTVSTSRTEIANPPGPPDIGTSRTEADRSMQGRVSLNIDLFDGFAMEGRSASAKARVTRARNNRDQLRRDLTGEVRQSMLAYNEALQRLRVSDRAVEAAQENVKLTQQKYNVGSATILELVDAQVQLQRARSDRVSALTAIRVAEAQVERVRGRGE